MKKKRRIRKSLLVILVIIIAGAFVAYYVPRERKKTELRDLGYQKETIEKILELEYYDKIMEHKYYSPLLEKKINNDTLIMDYIDLYANIHSDKDINDTDILLYSRLMDKGYDNLQLNELFDKLEFYEITPLLVFDYQWDEITYIEDCLNNRENNSPEAFHLNNNYKQLYRITDEALDVDSNHVLVNKNHYLLDSYTPKDLVEFSDRYAISGMSVRKNVHDVTVEMIENAINAGIPFYVSSAYWSYEDLETVYNNNIPIYRDEVDFYINRPGYSEHQTGLCFNITPTYESMDNYLESETYKWIKDNCVSYGFIMRYPPNKSIITNMQDEPTHLRYLGKELSKKVSESSLTYDEYYSLYLLNWGDDKYKPSDEILNRIPNYNKK